MQKPIPASYAQASNHAEHAIVFTAADGSRRSGRYHFVPDAAEAYLSPEVAGPRGPNFLRDELAARLRTGAGRVPPAGAGRGRRRSHRAVAGRPAAGGAGPPGGLTRIAPTSAEDERRLVFEPTTRTDGTDLSNDPILLARSAAYGISFERHSQGE